MRNNQISLQLAMRFVRFFNERPGSTENKNRLYRRMWKMYPSTTQRTFDVPYDFGLTDAEEAHRAKPMHLLRNPLNLH